MILASQSPRRRDLLKLITTDFLVIPANLEESRRIDESPADYVCRLAEGKARAIAHQVAPLETIIRLRYCCYLRRSYSEQAQSRKII